MTNYWEILGVPPTSELSTIKKAYAQLLKKHHPEDDPEGYQRLREAYDKAVKYVKASKKSENILNKDDITRRPNPFHAYSDENSKEPEFKPPNPLHTYYDENSKGSEFKPPNPLHTYNDDNSKEPDFKPTSPFNLHSENRNKISITDDIHSFLEKLNAIYSDITLRIKEENWRALFSLPIAWNIDVKPRLRREVFIFLAEHKYLPYNVWSYLNKEFNWYEHKEELYSIYSKDSVDMIISESYDCPPLSYTYVIDIKPELLNKYLDLRAMAYKSLYSNDNGVAHNYLISAYKICSSDLELIKLMGYFYFSRERYTDALKFFKEALTLDNNDLDCILETGKIYYLTKDYKKSILCFEKILSIKGYNYQILAALAFSYYYSHNLIKAKKLFIELIELYPQYSYPKKVLKNIEDKMKIYVVRALKTDGDISENFKEIRINQSRIPNAPKELYAPKEHYSNTKPKTSNHSKYLKYIAMAIILCGMAGKIYINRGTSTPIPKSTPLPVSNSSSNTMQNPITTLEELTISITDENYYVSLKDVRPLDCYEALTYPETGPCVTTYYNKSNISEDTSASTVILSQVYVGKLGNNLILFNFAYDNDNTPISGDSYTYYTSVKQVQFNLLEVVTPQIQNLYNDPELTLITAIYLIK